MVVNVENTKFLLQLKDGRSQIESQRLMGLNKYMYKSLVLSHKNCWSVQRLGTLYMCFDNHCEMRLPKLPAQSATAFIHP